MEKSHARDRTPAAVISSFPRRAPETISACGSCALPYVTESSNHGQSAFLVRASRESSC